MRNTQFQVVLVDEAGQVTPMGVFNCLRQDTQVIGGVWRPKSVGSLFQSGCRSICVSKYKDYSWIKWELGNIDARRRCVSGMREHIETSEEESKKTATIVLNTQYRCHPDIAKLVSGLSITVPCPAYTVRAIEERTPRRWNELN